MKVCNLLSSHVRYMLDVEEQSKAERAFGVLVFFILESFFYGLLLYTRFECKFAHVWTKHNPNNFGNICELSNLCNGFVVNVNPFNLTNFRDYTSSFLLVENTQRTKVLRKLMYQEVAKNINFPLRCEIYWIFCKEFLQFQKIKGFWKTFS